MRKNIKASLVLFSPAVACVALYLAMTTLPSYHQQRALVMLLVNYVLSNITFSLMLDTMTGKKFTAHFQPIIGLLLVPLISYHALGISAQTELWLSRMMTLLALVYFFGRMTIIAIQWGDYAGTRFWIIERSKRVV